MFVFLTNLSRVLLYCIVICIIMLSFVSASEVMGDTWSAGLRDELLTVGHMIDDTAEQSAILGSGRACRDAVTQLTDAVTQYADCVSQHALNASVCERCVDHYLNAASLVVTNFSVYVYSTVAQFTY